MQEDIGQIENKIVEKSNVQEDSIMQLKKEDVEKVVRKEYESMPSELKGYRVIRKDYYSKTRTR